MATTVKETRVTQGYLASIPASARRQLDIQPGDRLAWEVRKDRLIVRVRKQKERAFADFTPFDFGENTNATRDHDLVM